MAAPQHPHNKDSNKGGPFADPVAPAAARMHLWQFQGVRDALVILSIVGLIYVGYTMRSVTVPLLIALVLAYLFEPVVQRLTRFRGITRPGAVLIILLIVGVSVTVLCALTIPPAISETITLTKRFQEKGRLAAVADSAIKYLPEDARKEAKGILEWFGAKSPEVAPKAGEPPAPTPAPVAAPDPAPPAPVLTVEDAHIREVVREELATLGLESPTPSTSATSTSGTPWRLLGALGTTAEYTGVFLLALVQISLLAFLVPFYFFFFSVSFPTLLEFGRTLIPESNRTRALELIGAMDRAVSGFVRGRIVIAIIMGAMFALGWRVCGVPNAVALGFFVGVLSLVPYLGGIGVPLAVGLLLFDQLQLHESQRMALWGIFVWPTVVFVVVQSIEGYILTPIIAGKVTDLDPVTIVVAILAGGSVAGIYGMILAIPAAACGKIALKEVLLPRIRAWSRGAAPDPLSLEPPKS